ncbi:Uncharacterised protein [Pseudomonas aeruginosa]|nr:Uncharacterised protein [Pseudomonas aeruginosa]
MLEHNFPMDTIAMKFLLPLLLLFPLSALADDKDYDQCILDYQRTAKSGGGGSLHHPGLRQVV